MINAFITEDSEALANHLKVNIEKSIKGIKEIDKKQVPGIADILARELLNESPTGAELRGIRPN